MNVANSQMTNVSMLDSAIVTGGKNVSPEQQGMLGAMFALQMGNALQQSTATGFVPEVKTDEDFANLQDLMAMIAQLLNGTKLLPDQQMQQVDGQAIQTTEVLIQANQAVYQETVQGFTGQSVPTIDQIASLLGQSVEVQAISDKLPKLMEFLAQVTPQDGSGIKLDTESVKSLTAAFMNHGMSQEEATKFTESLAAFAKAGEQAKQSEVKVAAGQISQLLAQLGAKTADGKELITPKDNKLPGQFFKRTGMGPSFTGNTVSQSTQPVQSNLAMLKVNRALSSYQVEAAQIGNRTLTQTASQGNPLQAMTTPTVESNSKTNETFVSFQQQPILTQSSVQTAQSTGQANSFVVKSDQFAEQVTDVFVKQMKIGNLKGVTEAKIILHPQSLGQVDVKITSHNGVITAQFSVDNGMGKEVLDSQMAQLRTALTQQGLQVDRLEVTQQQSQQQFGFQQQKEQNKEQQSFTGKEDNKKSDKDDAVFSIESLVEGEQPVSSLWNRARMAGAINYSA
ncbi:flagellar hook-length control protein FliK [Brevibacillus sp. SYSU BS000544]|uniref:flagellar hook-length control protein FliK n=1 Tax=Brevibacillus sp. SYSU BS000544 TaxID=3416443 RepID=UPI003CE5688D